MTQKLIGIIGGASWTSTILYYERLNKLVNSKLGGLHSARIALYSLDYQPLRSLYYEADSWPTIATLLKAEIMIALRAQPDCLMIACNALHKAFDMIADELALTIPFFHPAKLAATELQL